MSPFKFCKKNLGRWWKDHAHSISLKRAQSEPSRERSWKLGPLIMGVPPPVVQALTRSFETQPTTSPLHEGPPSTSQFIHTDQASQRMTFLPSLKFAPKGILSSNLGPEMLGTTGPQAVYCARRPVRWRLALIHQLGKLGRSQLLYTGKWHLVPRQSIFKQLKQRKHTSRLHRLSCEENAIEEALQQQSPDFVCKAWAPAQHKMKTKCHTNKMKNFCLSSM